MSRRKREWYEGACYHVMGRGNRRCAIYEDLDDYYLFMEILAAVKRKFPFDLHAFCLMTNHFHLELTTKEIPIWMIMQKLMGDYARSFNYKHCLEGHLFENRYTSSTIKNDNYFREVSRYIHLNPVKAGIVEDPMDYPYSSCRYYISGTRGKIGDLLETSRILDLFGDQPHESYRLYIEEKMSHEEQEEQIREDIKEDKDLGRQAGKMWCA